VLSLDRINRRLVGLCTDAQALTKHNTPVVQYKIIALTRDANSGSAKQLASLPGVTVSQVGKDHQERPLEALQELGLKKGDVYGIFSCQAYVDDEAMFRQGGSGPYLVCPAGTDAQEKQSPTRPSRST